jgi:hypothetical protein
MFMSGFPLADDRRTQIHALADAKGVQVLGDGLRGAQSRRETTDAAGFWQGPASDRRCDDPTRDRGYKGKATACGINSMSDPTSAYRRTSLFETVVRCRIPRQLAGICRKVLSFRGTRLPTWSETRKAVRSSARKA